MRILEKIRNFTIIKKLNEHLTYVNNRLDNKFTIEELRFYETNITNAVKYFTDSGDKYVCAGIIVWYKNSENMEDILEYWKSCKKAKKEYWLTITKKSYKYKYKKRQNYF